MNDLTTTNSPPATNDAPTPEEIAHAIVLAVEGLVNDTQFAALTGRPVADISELLADPEMLTRVQRLTLELQNKGALARLEALKHSRDAVAVAAKIMNDDGLHPSPRLASAEFVSKVAGTMRPLAEKEGSNDRIRITINIPRDDGGEPDRVVDIEATRVVPTETGDS